MQLPEELAEALEVLFPPEPEPQCPVRVTAEDFCDAAGVLGWWPEIRYLRVASPAGVGVCSPEPKPPGL